MPNDAQNAVVVQAANAITLSKLKAIAERLHTKGQEPTTDEARFAATFVNSVKVETVIRWLEQLMDVMECDEDRVTVGRLIANLKG